MTTTETTNDLTLQVTMTISQERLEDLLCTAFEGGVNYWAGTRIKGRPAQDCRYVHQIPARGGTLELFDDLGEGWPEQHDPFLNRGALQRGLKVMSEKYPRHFADFLQEQEDATTADVFVQCAVFGEIVFG